MFPLGVYYTYESVNRNALPFIAILKDPLSLQHSRNNTTSDIHQITHSHGITEPAGGITLSGHERHSKATSTPHGSLPHPLPPQKAIPPTFTHKHNCTSTHYLLYALDFAKSSSLVTPATTDLDYLNLAIQPSQVKVISTIMPAVNQGQQQTTVQGSVALTPTNASVATQSWAQIATVPRSGEDAHTKINIRAKAGDDPTKLELPVKVENPVRAQSSIPFERQSNGNQLRKAKLQPKSAAEAHGSQGAAQANVSKAGLGNANHLQNPPSAIEAHPGHDRIGQGHTIGKSMASPRKTADDYSISMSRPRSPLEDDHGTIVVKLPGTSSSEIAYVPEQEEAAQVSVQVDNEEQQVQSKPLEMKTKSQKKRERRRQNKEVKNFLNKQDQDTEELNIEEEQAKEMRKQEEEASYPSTTTYEVAEAVCQDSSLCQDSNEIKPENSKHTAQRKKGVAAITKSGKPVNFISKNALIAKVNPSAVTPNVKTKALLPKAEALVPAVARTSNINKKISASPPSLSDFNPSFMITPQEMKFDVSCEEQTQTARFKGPLAQAPSGMSKQTKPCAVPPSSSFEPSLSSLPSHMDLNIAPAKEIEVDRPHPQPPPSFKTAAPDLSGRKINKAKVSKKANAIYKTLPTHNAVGQAVPAQPAASTSAGRAGTQSIFASQSQAMGTSHLGTDRGLFSIPPRFKSSSASPPSQGLFNFAAKSKGPVFGSPNQGLVAGPAASKAVLLPDQLGDGIREASPAKLPSSDTAACFNASKLADTTSAAPISHTIERTSEQKSEISDSLSSHGSFPTRTVSLVTRSKEWWRDVPFSSLPQWRFSVPLLIKEDMGPAGLFDEVQVLAYHTRSHTVFDNRFDVPLAWGAPKHPHHQTPPMPWQFVAGRGRQIFEVFDDNKEFGQIGQTKTGTSTGRMSIESGECTGEVTQVNTTMETMTILEDVQMTDAHPTIIEDGKDAASSTTTTTSPPTLGHRFLDCAYPNLCQEYDIRENVYFFLSEQAGITYPDYAAEVLDDDMSSVHGKNYGAVGEISIPDTVSDIVPALEASQQQTLAMDKVDREKYVPVLEEDSEECDVNQTHLLEVDYPSNLNQDQNRLEYTRAVTEESSPVSEQAFSSADESRNMTGGSSTEPPNDALSTSPNVVIGADDLEDHELLRRALWAAVNASPSRYHSHTISNVTSDAASVVNELKSASSATSLTTNLEEIHFSDVDAGAGTITSDAKDNFVPPSVQTSNGSLGSEIDKISNNSLETRSEIALYESIPRLFAGFRPSEKALKSATVPFHSSTAGSATHEDDRSKNHWLKDYLGLTTIWAGKQGYKAARVLAIIAIIPADLAIQATIIPPLKAAKTGFLVGRWACARFGSCWLGKFIGA